MLKPVHIASAPRVMTRTEFSGLVREHECLKREEFIGLLKSLLQNR